MAARFQVIRETWPVHPAGNAPGYWALATPVQGCWRRGPGLCEFAESAAVALAEGFEISLALWLEGRAQLGMGNFIAVRDVQSRAVEEFLKTAFGPTRSARPGQERLPVLIQLGRSNPRYLEQLRHRTRHPVDDVPQHLIAKDDVGGNPAATVATSFQPALCGRCRLPVKRGTARRWRPHRTTRM